MDLNKFPSKNYFQLPLWQLITSTEGFNTYVVETTDFHSWEDMVNEATTEYISKKLGF